MQSLDFDDTLLSFPPPVAALRPPAPAPGPLGRALAALRAWRERREARYALAQLDQRLLQDIGLSREGRRVDWIV